MLLGKKARKPLLKELRNIRSGERLQHSPVTYRDSRREMPFQELPRLEQVFRESLDVIFVVNTSNGKILAVSDAVQRVFGYSPSILVGRLFTDLFAVVEFENDPESLQVIYNAVLVDQPFSRADGSVELMDVTATMIHWDFNDAVLMTLRNTAERRAAEAEKAAITAELEAALMEVKRLSGCLPICSHCKKIRDDDGHWCSIEQYIRAHSEADFSHGICPSCLKRHYAEYDIS